MQIETSEVVYATSEIKKNRGTEWKRVGSAFRKQTKNILKEDKKEEKTGSTLGKNQYSILEDSIKEEEELPDASLASIQGDGIVNARDDCADRNNEDEEKTPRDVKSESR